MPNSASWDYTQIGNRIVGDRFQGRRCIRRDEPVSGGVWVVPGVQEAIVVDPQKYPEEYDRLYESAKQKASPLGVVERGRVLRAVFETVKEAMPYSQRGVDNVLEGLGPDKKIELSSFIANRTGVCRHQALACCALLERFKSEGHIRGNVSADRNMNFSPRGDAGGHAWARYTNSAGEVFILDVAQKFVGSLQESIGLGAWNYLRPEEQSRFAPPVKTAARIGAPQRDGVG